MMLEDLDDEDEPKNCVGSDSCHIKNLYPSSSATGTAAVRAIVKLQVTMRTQVETCFS